MVDMNEVQGLLQSLMGELDGLVQQREALRQQEDALKKQAAEMDRKIGGLKQSIQGLSLYSTAHNEPPQLTEKILGMEEVIASAAAMGQSRIANKSLTDCCREVLMRDGDWMTALKVRQGLHAAGFDFSGYTSNPLSSIHTTLKRIAENDQAWSRMDIITNDTIYRWKKKGELTAPDAPKRIPDVRPPSPKGRLTGPPPVRK